MPGDGYNGTEDTTNGIKAFQMPGQSRWKNGIDMLVSESHSVQALEKVKGMNLTATDTVVASYPKTGSSLLQEIVWLAKNNANVTISKLLPNVLRVPFIDVHTEHGPDSLTLFNSSPHPRVMRTHVPYNLLPTAVHDGTSKCIYIMRNPKDTLVSFYHFYRMSRSLGSFKGTWNDFFDYFERNDYLLVFGNPLDHMLTYWTKRIDPNLLIVFYEDMLADRTKCVREIAEFLDVKLTDEKIKKIARATSFDKMKSCPATNYDLGRYLPPGMDTPLDLSISPFMRKGEIGDWKNYFNEEQNRIMDEMSRQKLEGNDLVFRYE